MQCCSSWLQWLQDESLRRLDRLQHVPARSRRLSLERWPLSWSQTFQKSLNPVHRYSDANSGSWCSYKKPTMVEADWRECRAPPR